MGPAASDEQPLPGLFVAEGTAITAAVILPLHTDKASYGESPQRIGGLTPLGGKHSGPHADGKFVDFYITLFGGQKMAKLVDEDQRTKYQDRQYYGDKGIQIDNHCLSVRWF